MDESVFLDMVFCIILAAAFAVGHRRGFLRTVWKLAAAIVSVFLTIVLRGRFTGILSQPLALFICIRLALWLVYMFLDAVFTFPILKQTNKLAGGLAQVCAALVVVYVILAAAYLYGTDIFDGTVLCRRLYLNNPVLYFINSVYP